LCSSFLACGKISIRMYVKFPCDLVVLLVNFYEVFLCVFLILIFCHLVLILHMQMCNVLTSENCVCLAILKVQVVNFLFCK
jgi:hypothetical protein